MKLDKVKYDENRGPYVIESSKAATRRYGIIKQCYICGKDFFTERRYINRGQGRFCSFSCEGKFFKGEKNRNWKGGRQNHLGYVDIYMPGFNKRGYVMEHRIIIQSHLKRQLKKDEVVHHINGVRSDNRIENLRVMSNREHMKLHRQQISASSV